jgi:anti-anti-sigma regulatory factor
MAVSAGNRRQNERVFCGLPMEFNGCAGNAMEVTEVSVFIILSAPCPLQAGQQGVLKVTLENSTIIEERAAIARVTRIGIAVVSLERRSVLRDIMEAAMNGVKFVEHREHETIAHLRGELNSNFLEDFRRIYVGQEKQRKYILDFRSVVHVAPSGLGMLLQMEIYNQGSKGDIEVINCSPEVQQILSGLDVPEIAITISQVHPTMADEARKFRITIEVGQHGMDKVTIHIPPMFDYSCRHEFARIYRDRSRDTEYVLDFQNTLHIGKAAFGTMLLMKQHMGQLTDVPNIRIVNCRSNVLDSLYRMRFERYFDIVRSA